MSHCPPATRGQKRVFLEDASGALPVRELSPVPCVQGGVCLGGLQGILTTRRLVTNPLVFLTVPRATFEMSESARPGEGPLSRRVVPSHAGRGQGALWGRLYKGTSTVPERSTLTISAPPEGPSSHHHTGNRAVTCEARRGHNIQSVTGLAQSCLHDTLVFPSMSLPESPPPLSPRPLHSSRLSPQFHCQAP